MFVNLAPTIMLQGTKMLRILWLFWFKLHSLFLKNFSI